MKRLPSIAALTMAAALAISGCSSSTGKDEATTPAAETTTTAAAEETTAPAEEETSEAADADALGAKVEGVKVGKSDLLVQEDSDELLSAVGSAADDGGFVFDNQECACGMFGPWQHVLDADAERVVAMTDLGTVVTLMSFDSDDAASDFVSSRDQVITDCATFTITEPGEGSGTMTKSDVDVDGADESLVSDSVTTLEGQDAPGSEVVARKGSLVVVGYSAGDVNTTDEIAAAVSEIFAK